MRGHSDCVYLSVGHSFSLGPGSTINLPNTLQKCLVDFYNDQFPFANVYSRAASIDTSIRASPPNFLRDRAVSHKYLVLNGKRIVASPDIYKAPNSIVQARYGTSKFVGQVIEIFTHTQPPVLRPVTLLYVRWFQPLRNRIINTTLWTEW